MIQRPHRELVYAAAATLDLYATFRQVAGRKTAFELWCEDLGLDDLGKRQLAHLRVHLLLGIAKGELTYDDIDWSGTDVERRASSTGVEWADSMEEWLNA